MAQPRTYCICFLFASVIAVQVMAAEPGPSQRVTAWVVTEKGGVPISRTVPRHIWKEIDYSCVNKPISKVIADLNEHVPIKLNLVSLAEIGLTGNEPITIKQGKTPAAVLDEMFVAFDLSFRVNADAIDVTIVDDNEQEWEYDVTEFVTFQGRPIEDQWCDIDRLQQLVPSVVAPATWPAGNFESPHRIENDRVLMTISQQPHTHLSIHKLLNVMRAIGGGKQQRLIRDPFAPQKLPARQITSLTMWPVIVRPAKPDSYHVWIYDVSDLKRARPDNEAAWLVSLRKDLVANDPSATTARFSLGDRNVLCVNATQHSQDLVAKQLRSLVASLASSQK